MLDRIEHSKIQPPFAKAKVATPYLGQKKVSLTSSDGKTGYPCVAD
jgi:hypothetical protein